LAPEFPYPAAIDDCWQSYNWILNFSEEVLGINPKRIVMVGDSAGGNLVLGVALMAIKRGIRPPDGLVLAYPALHLSTKKFSPSLLLALDDQMIPYSLLKLCMQSYIAKGFNCDIDPFLSPLMASDELLSKLPPVRMFVGTKDPLHDDCWRFTQRLMNLGRDVRLVAYKEMPHGFLNYDMVDGVETCVKETADALKELLNKKAE